MSEIFIGSDNVVTLVGLKDVVLDAYINADVDSVIMSLFKEPALSISNAAAAVSEVHKLRLDAPATAGTWSLTYDGQTASGIAYDASLSTIKTTLETLSTIEVDDVVVGGNTLDTSPVGNGMTFTWADDLGDVDLMSFDVSGLTGPTQAGTTIAEDTKGVLLGVAVDEGSSKVGIPIIGHGQVAGDRVRIANSRNYNAEYLLTDTTNDKIIFTETYVAETFVGNAKVYLGVPGGCNISMSYVSGSNGNHRGILPDDIEGLIERAWYYLFIESKKSPTVKLDCVKWLATYSSLTTE